MLGLYDNFPESIHRITSFTFSIPLRRLQEKFIQAIYEVNNKTVSPEEISPHALRECEIFFETGVAESSSFTYLDQELATKLQEAVKREPLKTVDFFFAARYYKTSKEKKIPLRFDYFLVRAVFFDGNLEVRIFHERGPRYISPEDVGNFVVQRINRIASRKILRMISQNPLSAGS